MTVKPFWALLLLTNLGQGNGQVVFDTMNGPVRGETIDVNGKSLDVLRSIPYAKPPIGDLRFKPPQPADSWAEVLEAQIQPAACIQFISMGVSPGDATYFSGDFSEDCLYLGLWKPSNATKESNLPVMVWIYGGNFNTGMKDVEIYNGKYLAAEYDVIVVSMNYRVSALGFAYLSEDTLPGNLGLLDQLMAMKWIQSNIREFGGSADKVTIFGESAGSWSVGLHQFSPLSKGYFNNVIMQSGAPISINGMIGMYPHDTSRKHVKSFATALKCPMYSDWDIYSCMMRATVTQLMNATATVATSGIDFLPVVDGYFLPDEPLALMKRGEYQKSNVLIGVNKDEFSSLFSIAFFEPFYFTVYATGKKLAYYDIDWILPMISRLPIETNKAKVEAVRSFYESLTPNPRDNVSHLLTEMASDLTFDCPAHLFGSIASRSHDVFFYILNYRLSNIQLPPWTGVPHGYELELMFGLPLDSRWNYTDEDRDVSRVMMTYWTNFAKSGSPNAPYPVSTNWPTFNSQSETYMALDSGSNLMTRKGPRRHECAFVNEILPRIPGDEKATTSPPSCVWPEGNGSRSVRQEFVVFTAIVVLTLSLLK